MCFIALQNEILFVRFENKLFTSSQSEKSNSFLKIKFVFFHIIEWD